MLKRTIVTLLIFGLVITATIHLYSSEVIKNLSSSSTNVSYNIPGWNKSGSFTIQTSALQNALTQSTENSLQLLDTNGKVIEEVSSSGIKSQISLLERVKKNHKLDFNEIKKFDKIINSLETIKNTLDDDKKFMNLTNKMQTLSTSGGKSFSHTFQTVWGHSETVTGVVGGN